MGSKACARALPIVIAAALLLLGPSAWAVTFNFANTTDPPAAPDAMTPDGTPGHCDSSGLDLCDVTLTFSQGSLSVVASVYESPELENGNPGVIQDVHPNYGGLGIVDSYEDHYPDPTGEYSGNDNVNAGEIILLTFSESVVLNTVYFWDDHNDTDLFSHPGGGLAQFEYSTTGAQQGNAWTMLDLSHSVDIGVEGTTFYFRPQSSAAKDEFYVAGLDVTVPENPPVPEPATLGLLGAGLLGLAVRSRRRRS